MERRLLEGNEMEGNDVYIYWQYGKISTRTREEVDRKLDRMVYGSWYMPARIFYEISKRMNKRKRNRLEDEKLV